MRSACSSAASPALRGSTETVFTLRHNAMLADDEALERLPELRAKAA